MKAGLPYNTLQGDYGRKVWNTRLRHVCCRWVFITFLHSTLTLRPVNCLASLVYLLVAGTHVSHTDYAESLITQTFTSSVWACFSLLPYSTQATQKTLKTVWAVLIPWKPLYLLLQRIQHRFSRDFGRAVRTELYSDHEKET